MTDPQQQDIPCPFCGSKAFYRLVCNIVCMECGGEGPDGDEDTDESAFEAWNRRAASSPSQAQRDTLIVNMMRFSALTKHQARAIVAFALDGAVIDEAEFRASAPSREGLDWEPIKAAPVNELVVVYWIDRDGQERHDLDFWDEGVWSVWHEHAEHTEIIGGHGVPYAAPYTHWKRLGAPSSPSVAAEETCRSLQPHAKPPRRPDDSCADQRCKAMGGCIRKTAREETGHG